MKIEALVDSLAAATAAVAAGADQLELNSALELGGLTPSAGLVAAVCAQVKLPVYVMIRPRKAAFTYTASEIHVMQREIEVLGKFGVSGFVFGCLDAKLEVDVVNNRKLVQAASGLPCVFHRAFDLLTANAEIKANGDSRTALAAGTLAIEKLLQLGFKRILTKGRTNDILASLSFLKELQKRYADDIDFNYSGVRPHNVAGICRELQPQYLHLQARKTVIDRFFTEQAVFFGAQDDPSECEYLTFDQAYFQNLVKQIREIERGLPDAETFNQR